MRRTRERARAAAFDNYSDDFSEVSDTGLIEILTTAYRKAMTQTAAYVVAEMFKRMNPLAVAGTGLIPSFEPVPFIATVAIEPPPLVATVTGIDTATVTDNPPLVATVTESLVLTPLDGNAARDTEILARYAAGESKRGIAGSMGISDGTVRNVLKRHNTDAGAV